MRRLQWLGFLALALAIGFAAGYGIRATNAQPEAQRTIAVEAQTDPIEQFRTERQQMRQMQISQLNDLIYGGSAGEEIISMAQRQLLELMSWQEQEITLEGVLRLREFKDALVTVHTDSVNVLVRTDSLNRQQTAIILELVMRETGLSGGNVKIIPIN